jgi:hypothetical protein
MKRLLALLLTATLLLSWGCGKSIYDRKLNDTLDAMKYRQRLDAFLIPAPSGAKFKDFPLYIRPPKDMPLSTNFVLVADLPLGQFNLAESFLSQSKGNLHVLGRRKTAKKAAPKGAAPPPPEAPKGPFDQDVIALLRGVYGADLPQLQTPQYQNETKTAPGGSPSNQFRRLIFNASNGNAIRVFLYKKEPYDVALIWDAPAALERSGSLSSARDLTLQTFAVGRRAQNAFAGGVTPGDSSEGGGGGDEGTTHF